MPVRALRATAIGVAALAALFLGAACTVESSHSAGTAPSGGGGGGGTSGGNGAPSPQPMLVDVDTNPTLNAAPGPGVGVFTEYAAGGHWHVWWSCDTSVTGFGCSFDVNVSTAGSITNVVGKG